MKQNFADRKFVVGGIFVVIGLIFIFRLSYLQLFSDVYFEKAIGNATKALVDYPARGIILDRNKKVLVNNNLAYDLMVIPKKLKGIDTLAVCEILEMDTAEFSKRIRRIVKKNKNAKTEDVFMELITGRDFVKIKEELYKLKGFRIRPRTVRSYPSRTAAHVLGYLGEVNKKEIKKDTSKYYAPRDYLGKSGIEKQYEYLLRGQKGRKFILRDVHSNVQGSYKEGANDIPSVPGANLITTLDIDLQQYAEKLMQNKKGSIVAIEPSTGEVLTLLSSPAYDPSLLVGRKYGENYGKIARNKNKLFYNRAIQARYPPGSIFKPLQAAVAQDMGVGWWSTKYKCNKNLVGCHNHDNPLNLPQSIMHSCNPYYWNLFKAMINQNKSSNHFEDTKLGFESWREYVLSFGLGQRTGVDLPYEKRGSVPTSSYYDRYYRSRWGYTTIYSLSIGQGELLVVPIQMANLAAIIANKGTYYQPHLLKSLEGEYDEVLADSIIESYTTPKKVMVDPKHFDLVHEGMQWVVEKRGGTAGRARIEGIEVCGKTGTAQNPHGEDHSVFICFAPKDDPKIAIAVYVENAGAGGLWAAPIASLLVEKYLKGNVNRQSLEQYILDADLMDVQVEE